MSLLLPPMLAWALACTEGRVVDDGDGADLPGEYSYTPDDEAPVQPDPAALAAAIQDALGLALELTGEPIVQGYLSMVDEADEDCPRWYEQDGNVFWYDSCQADSGAVFDGYGFYTPYLDADLDGSGTLWTGDYLYGVASITGSDGTWFHAGGGTQVLFGRDEEANSWSAVSQVLGGFAWTADAAGDTWLSQGIVPDLYLYSVEYTDYDARGVYVSGGISAEDGLAGGATAVLFGENLVYSEDLGSPCEAEPAGSIQVRDAAGRWWEVAFDTPDEGTLPAAQCDGCGTVFLAGQEQTGVSVCVDFTPWLDWEVTAW